MATAAPRNLAHAWADMTRGELRAAAAASPPPLPASASAAAASMSAAAAAAGAGPLCTAAAGAGAGSSAPWHGAALHVGCVLATFLAVFVLACLLRPCFLLAVPEGAEPSAPKRYSAARGAAMAAVFAGAAAAGMGAWVAWRRRHPPA